MRERALKLIQPVSKRDQVIASFKEAILSGVIQPGESIVESKVAQQLGGRHSAGARGADRAGTSGVCPEDSLKGTTVTKLEQRDVEKIFRLRVELESLAIEWAKDNVTPADIEDLRSIPARMKEGAGA
jgi:DNA-binding GntR family transcriptional regulator